MTDERYKWLENTPHAAISKQEADEGWHWCYEFDLLLVGPGMGELEVCKCLPEDHPVYKTIPKRGTAEESK